MNPLKQLSEQGQSIWLDYIRRNLITSGGLKRLVEEDGIRGVTSNPTIFDKAISGSTDYDDALRAMLAADQQTPAGKLYERLVIEDIRMGCRRAATGLRREPRRRPLRQPRGVAPPRPRYRGHD